MSYIKIEVDGADKIANNLDKVGNDLPNYLRGAGTEASNEILDTKGLRNYPPATGANAPPPPFYIRGRGMQVSYSRNLNNSQRLGTRWQVLPYKKTGTSIANPVTYAKWVHGAQQARAMARIGWRKLWDVAKEKVPQITDIYNRWVGKLLKRHGL